MSFAFRHFTILAAVFVSVELRSFAAEPYPSGWESVAQREEIRPTFAFDPKGGPKGNGAFVIVAGDSVGQHGHVPEGVSSHWRKVLPVRGGAQRWSTSRSHGAAPRSDRVAGRRGEGRSPDPPASRENEAGPIPLAEPEHPLDGAHRPAGLDEAGGRLRAPTKATQAVVELHSAMGAPRPRGVECVTFRKRPAAAEPQGALATVHYTPSGKSPRANCEEYAPLIAEAARQKADLVVLGETVPYVRVGKKPHETAETIPGPTTEYFGELARKHDLHVVVSLYERTRRSSTTRRCCSGRTASSSASTARSACRTARSKPASRRGTTIRSSTQPSARSG